MKLNVQNIFLVARSEYIKWLCNPRMIMVLTMFIPVRELIILPMVKAAAEMNQPLNLFEPCIASANSGLVLLFLPLIYIVLMAAFPTVDGNMLFYITRMGRKNWILGEILFQMMSAVTYCAAVICITAAQTANVSFLADGWSIAVTDYDKMDYAIAGFHMGILIPPNLFYQMSPYKALFLSYFLLTLFLLLCSMAFLLGSLWGKKLLSLFLIIVQILLGCGLFETKSGFMWLLPFSHSILTVHYQKYFRKYTFSPGMSIFLFLILLAVLAVMSYQKAKNVNLHMTGEI